MDQLDAEQLEQLKKCSTERLRFKLIRVGEDEEAVVAMDRPKLLEAVARSMLMSKTEVQPSSDARSSTEIRLKELELEEKRIELKKEEKRIEKEKEETKMKMDMELRRMEIDREVRLSELRVAHGDVIDAEETDVGYRTTLNPRWADSLAGRTKRYGETLKHVLPPMPTEIAELPQFFDTVEKLYTMYDVPDDLRSKLLIPLLTARAKSVIGRMAAHDMENYDEVKRFLLAEFKLTPKEYKSRFDSAVKNRDETFVLFAARLRNLLMYYLRSRDVGDDFEKLCELIVSDRLKSCLPNGPLNYVLSLEGDDWFESGKVATLADIYMNNHNSSTMRSSVSANTTNASDAYSNRFNSVSANRMSTGGRTVSNNEQRQAIRTVHSARGGGTANGGKRCYRCQSFTHLARFCPRGRGTGTGTREAQVNFCSTIAQNRLGENYELGESDHDWEFGEFPKTDPLCDNAVKISPLSFVDVTVADVSSKALCDSGAQIPVVSKRLFDQCNSDVIGSVCLQGVIGKSVDAPLVNLSVKLDSEKELCNISPDMSVICAVADINADDYDVILPTDIVEELRKLPDITVPIATIQVQNTENVSDDTVIKDLDIETAHNVDDVISDEFVSDSETLIKEQQDDVTLANCWALARNNKGGFVISQELLYHNDKVEGQSVCQLCVPECRRDRVLKLAHDSVFGGHLGERKTRERIRLSFHWPKLRDSVRQYVLSCTKCQLRSRVKTTDRVPIAPITRAEVPFQVLNMDCIGPLDPPSAQGHRYCLCIVDSCTRWPAVYVLKSLTAKSVCNALLDLFVNVGVPKVIVSDCGTNFTSQLTREMLTRLGCSPRFNTPGHPEASGLVERFNQTCKNMLYHVVQEHRRQWHKFVPLMVWALREVPNSTTGTSPYMLVYGRTPRGPLAVLKESWTGERDVSMNLSKPVDEYLCELKTKLETAANYAEQHAKNAQTEYTARYNLRSKDKQFSEGDQVIVLASDSSGKLCSRWHGPATVVKVKSPYSYLVDMGDGNVRHIHANKMRKFVARIQGFGVVAETDDDFGRMLTPLSDVCTVVLPSNRVEAVKLEHLDTQQREQLLHLLDEFAVCFVDKPGLCDVVEHRIVTTPQFIPKLMRPYRVPELLKPEVDHQIKELLDSGLIRPSNSPMASPIVCVAKKQGGVRIACDYRYVNSFTIGDAFPMPTVNETLYKIGGAKFISTFDAKSGYWQIPVAKEDRWLTAFVTHDGLFEWVRMPFGLKNAGATFVRAVRTVLQSIRSFSETYVDDMGIGSGSWSDHLSHLRQFLVIIRDNGMTLNLAKCNFAQPEVKFVGHFVGSGIRRPDPQRLEGIANMTRPHTRSELRKLLGVFSYYREYVPNFASIAKPLTDLTKKQTPSILPWNEEHQVAFECLRSRLCSPHVLRIPQFGKPFCLHTDASGVAVGATLGQLDEDGIEQPLAYASQKLTGPQSAWSTIEREAYAIIWALNRFKDIVYGARITVFCDHNPLQYIKECAPKSAKLLRWALALQEFDIELRYAKGSDNVVADYLSRNVM